MVQIDQLKEYLSSQGLKSTAQRDTIVQTFLETENHIDIETLYQKVKTKNPAIGFATVYRTMKLLKNSGIAHERHFGTRHAVYEPHTPDQHHDHLICIRCKKIIEFENTHIEKLQEQVAKKYKFKLTSHKHELYGYCRECQKK
ncbi:MAG TPA: transcriptional repressor [Deltaproteobacteria bacterium]|nr:transcriptional repressor [Deltaproteobacteria bacterium]